MIKYEIKKGKIYVGESILPIQTIMDKLNIFEEIIQTCTKHNIKELGGDLRLLADFFDKKDDEDELPHSTEVQDSLHKSANIFSFLGQKIIEKIDKNEKI